MEAVLKDLYERKQSNQIDSSEFVFELLNHKLDRKLSNFNNFATNAQNGRAKRKSGIPDILRKDASFEEQIQDFGKNVAVVPGFEDLEGKTNPSEIVCWSLVLFVLIGLTGYSFVHLIMDYLDNPTITSVHMEYSPYTFLPSATLCIPFHVDRVPFAGTTESHSFYPWKDTADLLGILRERNQNIHRIFTCPHDGQPHDIEKKNVKIRLINEKGMKNSEYGRVEIGLDGLWGTVCDTQWDTKDAQVVCKMITGETNENVSTIHLIQTESVPDVVWMDNVECRGTEDNIGHCTHSGWGETDCSELNLAAVDCTGTANPAVNVRLKNEAGVINRMWGAVEVSYHGIWGKISEEMWGHNESIVVCRMLGWTDDVGRAFNRPTLAHGHGPTWFTKVQCTGNESTIENCSYELTSRKYSFMAGVDCSGNADQEISLTREMVKNFTVGRTAGAILARITAFETWNLVKGETPASFKWSTSPTYPAGNVHKEGAMESLLGIMDKTSRHKHPGDLKALHNMFSCSLCNTINLALYLQIADKDCIDDFENCEIRCIAKEFASSCSGRCIPFTWEKLIEVAEDGPHYCLLEDYKKCYRHADNVTSIASLCSAKCKQPCHRMTYSVKTLFKKPLSEASSQTKLYIQMDSEVYPEFTEESVITWYQLMGDMGGVIGLWLGASFVGVLHFFEFMLKDLFGGRKKKNERIRGSIRSMHSLKIHGFPPPEL